MIGLSGISYLGRRASVSGPSSTQWRWLFPQGSVGSTTWIGASECAMMETVGGPDISTSGQASAHSTSGGPYVAGTAFNDNPFDFWLNGGGANNAVNGWLQQTFGTPKTIRQFQYVCGGFNADYRPKQILLQYFGASWTTVYTSPVFTGADWTAMTNTLNVNV